MITACNIRRAPRLFPTLATSFLHSTAVSQLRETHLAANWALSIQGMTFCVFVWSCVYVFVRVRGCVCVRVCAGGQVHVLFDTCQML